MMCPGVFLTVELAAHPAVLAIVRTIALAIAKSLESIFISVIERAAKRRTVDNRTRLLRRCSVTGRLMLATRPVLTGSAGREDDRYCRGCHLGCERRATRRGS
jgi:hypothetical protein